MSLFITLLLTLVIGGLLFALFRWLKNPWYRVDAERMLRVVELALTGQATANDWYTTFGMTIRHDPELEAIRVRCLEIEAQHFIGGENRYLFRKDGLNALENIRQELQRLKST